jgi:hypothetical protein
MKLNGLLLALLFVCGVASAQKSTFEKGDKVLNLGIGVGGNYYSSWSGVTKTPFLSASFDVGVVDNVLDKGTIGVGGFIGYESVKWEETWSYTGEKYGWKESNLVIGPRGTFHYPLLDKLDTYAGLLLGYHSLTNKRTGDWTGIPDYSWNSSGVYFSGFIGARYYFTDKFGVMLELGSGGLSVANIGLAVKF